MKMRMIVASLLMPVVTAVAEDRFCLAHEMTKLIAPDGAYLERMGTSVAIQGDTALVGAPNARMPGTGNSVGAVYVYRLEGGVTWTLQQKLMASDWGHLKFFGNSLAVDGDRVAVGSPGWKDVIHPENDVPSAVYIFHFNGSEWVEETEILPLNGERLPGPVVIQGDSLFVATDLGNGAGGVSLYEREDLAWVYCYTLVALDGFGNCFGKALAREAGRLVVGASCDDEVALDSGAAYVFDYDGSTWIQTAKLTAPDGPAEQNMGRAVDVSGPRVLLGAPYNDEAAIHAGAAYAFEDGAGGWVEQAKLLPPDAKSSMLTGYSVAVQDDLAFAGAHKYYSHSAIDGAVYVYRFNGAAWNPGVRITASDAGLESGWLGFAVDVCGDYLLVGAPSARTSNGDQSGAAYIFRGVITDCNSDGISDLLNIAECFSGDCNRNSVPDECDLASGDSLDQNGNSRPDECEVGDLNCDGITGFGDINPFVLILANRELWQQAYPSCLWSFGDINSDGSVDFGDINPFVELLSGGM